MSKTQVITGVERRRKFSDEDKARIVAEIAESSLSIVSRKYGISLSCLSNWKKKFSTKSFALVKVQGGRVKPSSAKSLPYSSRTDVIRVVIHQNVFVEFPLSSEPTAIARFIRALEA